MTVLTAIRLAPAGSLPLDRPRSRTIDALGICLFISAGILCACFAYLVMFTTFRPYDDDGWMMFTIRRMLDGKALYRDMKLPYGPTYYLTRWLVFGAGHVPLNNDTSRILALGTWIVGAVLLGMTARVIGGWFVGAFAVTIAIEALNAIANEPGHPQEVHILLLIVTLLAAGYWQKRSSLTSDRWFWVILGAGIAAMALTKINVGMLFTLSAIGASSAFLICGKGSRLLFFLFCAGLLILPWMLMAGHPGWAGFAGLVTLSLAPVLIGVLVSAKGAGFDRRQLLSLLAGACIGTIVPVGFALLQGNNFADMFFALVTRPRRFFIVTNWGWPLEVRPAALAWAASNSCIGVVLLIITRSRQRAPGNHATTFARLALVAARLIGFGYAVGVMSGCFGDIAATSCLAWLAIAETPTEQPPSDRTRFFRRLVAFAVCLLPLQAFPVPGSQIRMGMLPITVLIIVVLCDLLADLRDLNDGRSKTAQGSTPHIGLAGVLRAIVWTMALIPGLAISAHLRSLLASWNARPPIDLPGCRLTHVAERDAVIYRFLAANVGELSDGYLAQTGLNSLHWWANVPVISSTPVGNTWTIFDADSDADLLSAYSTRPRLMFLAHASFFPCKEVTDLRISRFIANNFRPLCVWDWTLLVRKDRLDSLGLADVRDCAIIVGQSNFNIAGKSDVQYVLKLATTKNAPLQNVARAQIVDYGAGTTLFDIDIPPGGLGSLQLSIHMDGQDLEKAMKPAVRLLDRNGRVSRILPIVFAPEPY